eukprot:3122081-Prymnesium_polylepis.2
MRLLSSVSGEPARGAQRGGCRAAELRAAGVASRKGRPAQRAKGARADGRGMRSETRYRFSSPAAVARAHHPAHRAAPLLPLTRAPRARVACSCTWAARIRARARAAKRRRAPRSSSSTRGSGSRCCSAVRAAGRRAAASRR